MRGALHLIAATRFDRTVLLRRDATPPFHLVPGTSSHWGEEVILQGVGPGILPGDVMDVVIDVTEGACLSVRSQGAQRVHGRSPATRSEVSTSLRATNGLLVYRPGELIPFANSWLQQRTTIEVTGDGRIAMLEILTPGRMGRGECHQWHILDMRLQAYIDGGLILQERANLQPALRAIESTGRHGSWSIAATLYLIGRSLPPMPELENDNVISAYADGNEYRIVRLFGYTVQAIDRAASALLAPFTQP